MGKDGRAPQNAPCTDVAQAAHGLDCQNHTPEQTRLHIIKTIEYGKVSIHMCSYAGYTWKTKAHAIFLLCQRAKLFPNVFATSCQIKQKSTEINPKATLSVQEKEKRGKI